MPNLDFWYKNIGTIWQSCRFFPAKNNFVFPTKTAFPASVSRTARGSPAAPTTRASPWPTTTTAGQHFHKSFFEHKSYQIGRIFAYWVSLHWADFFY
jgi:hypothetical protein